MSRFLWACMLTAYSIGAQAQACCCTGAGANYSILPNIDKHLVGVRYTYSNYSTSVSTSMNMNMNGMDMSMNGPSIPATETMNTIDVFGRFNLYKGLQLSVFMPVHVLAEKTSGSIQHSAGLGDMSFLLQYALLDPKKCNGKKSKHQLRLGTGIKLPSGKFSMTQDGMFTTDLQMGTGSVDFLFNAVYTYRYKKFGFNILSSYKLNTVNPQDFRFGDKVKAGANLFYVFNITKALSIMPIAGSNFEHDAYNAYKGAKLNYTGGEYLTATAGFDVYFKHLAWSTSISPVLMSISNWEGEPVPKLSFDTGLYYNF